MHFSPRAILLLQCLLLLTGGFISLGVRAQEPFKFELKVKPAKCIALRKGQECFQTLKFRWLTPEQGDYCLYIQHLNEPLRCWQGAAEKSYDYEFVSPEARRFSLRNQAGDILQEVEVVVAWVYNSGRREASGWRLF